MKTLFYFIISILPSGSRLHKIESEFPVLYHNDIQEADREAKVRFYHFVQTFVRERGNKTKWGIPVKSLLVNEFKEHVLTCGIYDTKRELVLWMDGDYSHTYFDCSDGEFYLCAISSADENISNNALMFAELINNQPL